MLNYQRVSHDLPSFVVFYVGKKKTVDSSMVKHYLYMLGLWKSIIIHCLISYWLVDLTILKNMSSSMGRMTSHILWKIKAMFETTNQPIIWWVLMVRSNPSLLIWLVVEPTPLKNMKVSWDDDIPNIWKHKKCSKPPTSSSDFYSINLSKNWSISVWLAIHILAIYDDPLG